MIGNLTRLRTCQHCGGHYRIISLPISYLCPNCRAEREAIGDNLEKLRAWLEKEALGVDNE